MANSGPVKRDAALKRGNMPLQAKANGLQLCPIPSQLSDLNSLEIRLIPLRVPFMKWLLCSLANKDVYMAQQ
jgi:hypothetical protein